MISVWSGTLSIFLSTVEHNNFTGEIPSTYRVGWHFCHEWRIFEERREIQNLFVNSSNCILFRVCVCVYVFEFVSVIPVDPLLLKSQFILPLWRGTLWHNKCNKRCLQGSHFIQRCSTMSLWKKSLHGDGTIESMST